MPFNIIPNVSGLFTFFKKYGIGTVEEILDIINGFLTTTPGVYNPVFSQPKSKWKNVKIKPYEEKEFDFDINVGLNIICNKKTNKKFSILVLNKFDYVNKDDINVISEIKQNDNNKLSINYNINDEKIENLNVLSSIKNIISNTLNLKTIVSEHNYTPITVKTWVKLEEQNRVGVVLLSEIRDRLRVYKRYNDDDIAVISDLEILNIIKEIEIINGIK